MVKQRRHPVARPCRLSGLESMRPCLRRCCPNRWPGVRGWPPCRFSPWGEWAGLGPLHLSPCECSCSSNRQSGCLTSALAPLSPVGAPLSQVHGNSSLRSTSTCSAPRNRPIVLLSTCGSRAAGKTRWVASALLSHAPGIFLGTPWGDCSP